MKNEKKDILFTTISQKIDFNSNILLFKSYLSSIFSQITNNNSVRMNIYSFYHLTQWPLFVAEKIYFFLLKNSNNKLLTPQNFCDKIVSFFSSPLKDMVEIVCDILDYDNDKEIHYEDVKIFFIHFHMMSQSDKNEQNLYEIILNFFEGKQKISKGDFIWKSININSDIVMLFMIFIAQFCFYNKEVLDYYEKTIYVSENKLYFEKKNIFLFYHLTSLLIDYGLLIISSSNEVDLDEGKLLVEPEVDPEDLNELCAFEKDISEIMNEIEKEKKKNCLSKLKPSSIFLFTSLIKSVQKNIDKNKSWNNTLCKINNGKDYDFLDVEKTATTSNYTNETSCISSHSRPKRNSNRMMGSNEFIVYIKEGTAPQSDLNEESNLSKNQNLVLKFTKAKLIIIKNNIFVTLYYKNVFYQSYIYLSSLTSHLTIEKVSFPSHPQIKYSVTIEYSFGNVNNVNVFYSDTESSLKLFQEMFNFQLSPIYNFKDIHEDYSIMDEIGKGKFGTVKQAKQKDKPNKTVAVKVVDKETNKIFSVFEINQWEKYIFLFLKKISHPNIIQPLALYEDVYSIYYVYEYVECGDLKNFITKGNVNSGNLMKITYQIVNGLHALHNYGIIHRDLKPSNILINKDTVVKIIDFGLSKVVGLTETVTRQCGSLSFKSPELLMGKNYNFKTDIWSLGVSLFYLKNKKMPFLHSNKDKLKEMIINANDFPKENYTLSDNLISCKKKSNEIISIFTINSIIGNCLVKDPKKRFSINEIMNQYFSNYVY